MSDIHCIFPDCEVKAVDDDAEKAKRAIVNHINADHDEGHILVACAHDWQKPVKFKAKTTDGRTGKPVEFPQIKSECARCGQFEIKDAVDAGTAAPDVTVSDIEGAPV